MTTVSDPEEDPAFDLTRGLRQAEVILDLFGEAFVSYDKRRLEAADDAGLPIASPGMKK